MATAGPAAMASGVSEPETNRQPSCTWHGMASLSRPFMVVVGIVDQSMAVAGASPSPVHDPASAQPPPTLTCCSLFLIPQRFPCIPSEDPRSPAQPNQPILPSRRAPGAAAYQQHRHGTALVSSGFNVPRRGGVFLFHFEQSNTRGRGGTERRPIENASPTAAASASLPVRYGCVRRASWYHRLRATCHISYPSRAPLALVDLFGYVPVPPSIGHGLLVPVWCLIARPQLTHRSVVYNI